MISLIMTFFVFNQSSSATFRDFTLHDRILPNRNFESFPTSDWLQCIEACHTAPRCISYNFDAKSTNSCILNNCGFRDRCEALRNVVVSSGAIFHQLKEVGTDFLILSSNVRPHRGRFLFFSPSH